MEFFLCCKVFIDFHSSASAMRPRFSWDENKQICNALKLRCVDVETMNFLLLMELFRFYDVFFCENFMKTFSNICNFSSSMFVSIFPYFSLFMTKTLLCQSWKKKLQQNECIFVNNLSVTGPFLVIFNHNWFKISPIALTDNEGFCDSFSLQPSFWNPFEAL